MAAKHSCKGRVKAGGLFCGAMLDRRTIAEIQTLRVKLQHFGSEQQDPAVQFYCLAVESNLAQALHGRDDPMLREVLTSLLEQLEEALRSAALVNLSTRKPARLRA